MTKKISIYGLGNFGYSILKHLDSKSDAKISLHAYDRNKQLIDFLKKENKHLFLHKSIKVSKYIHFHHSTKTLISDCDVLILAVNSDSTREVLRKIKKYINKKLIIVNTAKALDYKTGQRLSQIVNKEFSGIEYYYALLAGGTIAKDLFHHEPLGADIACEDEKVFPDLINLFQSRNLSVYPTKDLVGTEYASAFKNLVAILAGIIKGMNFSYGSETHIISRFAFEIEKIAVNKLGAKSETFSMKSQCWGNDLWMSCTGDSRHREFGILLGNGKSVEEARKEMFKQRKTIEGLRTIQALNNVVDIADYPLLQFLYQFISKRSTNLQELKELIVSHKY